MPRGRPPTLTSVKKARGTINVTREVEQEPEFLSNEPGEINPPPECFDGRALIVWETLEPILREARVLKRTDLVVLEQYCRVYVNFTRAQQVLDDSEILIESASGELKKNPAITAVGEFSRELRGLSAQLGLDPANRTRINVGKLDATKTKGFGDLKPKARSNRA
jgi:P27 family predicted phage terminase small subunit